MSAYVNCGMIDPLRMARDATRISEKFVSEFCGFRESAHLWCLRNPGAYLDASRGVPAWARNQLRATVPAPDADALARGASGDGVASPALERLMPRWRGVGPATTSNASRQRCAGPEVLSALRHYVSTAASLTQPQKEGAWPSVLPTLAPVFARS